MSMEAEIETANVASLISAGDKLCTCRPTRAILVLEGFLPQEFMEQKNIPGVEVLDRGRPV
jgi:hypothetical protein